MRKCGQVRWVAVVGLVMLMAACSGDVQYDATPPVPTSVDEPAIFEVVRRNFTISAELDGETVNSEYVALESDPRYVVSLAIEEGDAVARGDTVGDRLVKPDLLDYLVANAPSSAIDRHTLSTLKHGETSVRAPVAGTLVNLDGASRVESWGVDVRAPVSAATALRIRNQRFAGDFEVLTDVGTRRAACAAVWIESDSDLHFVRCRVPNHYTTLPGTRAWLSLFTETIEGALLVPSIYISHDPLLDQFYVLVEEGRQFVRRPVDLGPTDGAMRVVEAGLAEGEVVLLPDE